MRSLIKSLRLNFLFKLNSLIWQLILKLNGIKVGRNFYIEGVIYLKLNGTRNLSKVEFGDNVNILGDIDIRTREEGCIFISDFVSFDNDVRLVAARSGKINIKKGCEIGKGSIFNAGADLCLEENILVGPYCLIQASNHGIKGKGDIKGQKYLHKPITIKKGSWIAANVVILPGTIVGKGSVIGASAIVTKNTKPNSINVGNPSRYIGNRLEE